MTVVTAEAAAGPARQAPEIKGKSIAWWGMAMTILTEAMIFAGLLSSYIFVRAAAKEWPPHPVEAPELERISLFTVLLLGSSLPMVWAERGIRKGDVRRLRIGLVLVIVMGGIFFANQLIEYHELHFGIRDHAYGSLFYTITGLHGAHLVAGIIMVSMLLVKASLGKFTAERHATVEVIGMYWHFVDLVWVFVFSTLYVSTHFFT